MRLQKMIALSSELSRRSAEKAIADGRVNVNGKVETTLGTTVDPRTDFVSLDGKQLKISVKRHYIAFNKPRNVLVTKSDPQGRPTIWEYMETWKESLNSVGRLDFDSEGLLLLTDDGDFLNKLTHPKHEIWKVYRARIKGVPSETAMKKLQNGIELDDGKTLPAKTKRIDEGDENALIEIGIREGRNRQVRRMFDAINCPVIRLRRVAVGPVKLGRLKVGEWRHLKADEVLKLLSEAREGTKI